MGLCIYHFVNLQQPTEPEEGAPVLISVTHGKIQALLAFTRCALGVDLSSSKSHVRWKLRRAGYLGSLQMGFSVIQQVTSSRHLMVLYFKTMVFKSFFFRIFLV